jgi:hypothetical protein
MAQTSASVERQLRIELLRTRAAIERAALGRHAAEIGQALKPRQLVHTLLPGLDSKGGTASLLTRVVDTARRHPMITSALPSFLLGKSRIVRVAALALTGWQFYKAWRDSREGAAPAGE